MDQTKIEKLKALALAATPQNIDSSEDATQPTGYIECPECGGDGSVELTADYCNYDGKAMGVQFYGIGPEHRAAEAFFRAANPAAVHELCTENDALRAEVERLQLKAGQDFHRWERTANAYRYRAEKAEAEVERLRAEYAELRESSLMLSGEVSRLQGADLAAKHAAPAAGTVKDAARYRWLRDTCPDFEAMTTAWMYDDLDRKIDAAIEAHTKAGKEQE